MRFFEKISYRQFAKDISDDKMLYDSYNLPNRSTKKSAGYDIKAIKDYVIKPNEIVKIPTGIKVSMNDDEVLFLIIRSSFGFKYNARLCNQVGVVDADYYNNIDNEGHIFVAIKNEGDIDLNIKKGQHFVQGIFMKFLTVDNESEDLPERIGGIGTTTK